VAVEPCAAVLNIAPAGCPTSTWPPPAACWLPAAGFLACQRAAGCSTQHRQLLAPTAHRGCPPLHAVLRFAIRVHVRTQTTTPLLLVLPAGGSGLLGPPLPHAARPFPAAGSTPSVSILHSSSCSVPPDNSRNPLFLIPVAPAYKPSPLMPLALSFPTLPRYASTCLPTYPPTHMHAYPAPFGSRHACMQGRTHPAHLMAHTHATLYL